MFTVFKLWFVRGGDWKTVDLASCTDLHKINAKYAVTTGEKSSSKSQNTKQTSKSYS